MFNYFLDLPSIHFGHGKYLTLIKDQKSEFEKIN
jgi:hypothetical protein